MFGYTIDLSGVKAWFLELADANYRALAGLAPISTMRASPASLIWVNPEITPVIVRLRLLFPCRDWPASQRHTTIAAPATGVR